MVTTPRKPAARAAKPVTQTSAVDDAPVDDVVSDMDRVDFNEPAAAAQA